MADRSHCIMADEEGLGLEYIMLISIFSCLFAYPLMKMVPLVVKAWIAFYRFMVRDTAAMHDMMLQNACFPNAHPSVAFICTVRNFCYFDAAQYRCFCIAFARVQDEYWPWCRNRPKKPPVPPLPPPPEVKRRKRKNRMGRVPVHPTKMWWE